MRARAHTHTPCITRCMHAYTSLAARLRKAWHVFRRHWLLLQAFLVVGDVWYFHELKTRHWIIHHYPVWRLPVVFIVSRCSRFRIRQTRVADDGVSRRTCECHFLAGFHAFSAQRIDIPFKTIFYGMPLRYVTTLFPLLSKASAPLPHAVVYMYIIQVGRNVYLRREVPRSIRYIGTCYCMVHGSVQWQWTHGASLHCSDDRLLSMNILMTERTVRLFSLCTVHFTTRIHNIRYFGVRKLLYMRHVDRRFFHHNCNTSHATVYRFLFLFKYSSFTVDINSKGRLFEGTKIWVLRRRRQRKTEESVVLYWLADGTPEAGCMVCLSENGDGFSFDDLRTQATLDAEQFQVVVRTVRLAVL